MMGIVSNVLYSCKKLIAFFDDVKDRKQYKLDDSITMQENTI